MSRMDRFLPPGAKTWVSAVCRLLPPTMQFSVSLLEITDAHIQFLSGRNVPTTDTHTAYRLTKLDRLTPDQFYFNSLPSKEAA